VRLQELFLQELTARSHAALQEDKQRKALDYKDVGACCRPACRLVAVMQHCLRAKANTHIAC
jgi:hypothetical protein